MAKLSNLVKRRNRMGLVYTAPWVIGFLAFQAFPILYSLYMSFHRWDMLTPPKQLGWANYQSLLTDARFMLSLRNTIMFMFFSMVVGISLGVFIAALLAENIRGAYVYRTIFYLPNLVVPVAFGMMMRPIFGGQDYGLINIILAKLGFNSIQWLDRPSIGIWVMIITNFWFIGACMIIFLAGVKSIPKAYYEAAEIDGAGWWNRFFKITVPLLGPVIFFQTISGLIYALQIFDIPISLANLGGSMHTTMGRNDSLGTLVYYLYMQGFRNWSMGRAAAIGWVIFAIGLLLTVVIIRVSRTDWYTKETNN